MIQKRYEYFVKNGKKFSPWFNCEEDDTKLETLQKEKWQLKDKLLNEYRIINN